MKRNRAHKQYSARLTRWLDRLSHFDVNLQYTAGRNIPLTDYLSRHPIISTAESGTENGRNEQRETESEEEFVINQIHGLLEFIQTNGSIKEFAEPTERRVKSDQSQRGIHKRKQNDRVHLLEISTSSDGIHSELPEKLSKAIQSEQQSIMDHVYGIGMHFIHKKKGHSPETHRLWMERKQILKPEKTRIVGRGKDNERLQAYRPSQQGKKRIAELNTQIYNRFFHYCETLGTTPLREYQQNNHESWLNNNFSTGKARCAKLINRNAP